MAWVNSGPLPFIEVVNPDQLCLGMPVTELFSKESTVKQSKSLLVAQCWYRAGDYEKIKAAMEDGYRLPSRYEDWLAGAEQREDQARSQGATPVRVPFDLAEFLRFCAHFGVAINADSRSKFAALKAQMDADAAIAPASGKH
ncbi:hypothetical protein [Alcaligenes faecalis]|uniref:hypothetical protein n=1 Tax=Alcaligenes faecalis TaxID=511 RepID=UPI00214F635B|nr:hypothetical protein [Alcaligenes faecalis]MCR4146725.1 hypothetical protein [Alcaligenes faecalis]